MDIFSRLEVAIMLTVAFIVTTIIVILQLLLHVKQCCSCFLGECNLMICTASSGSTVQHHLTSSAVMIVLKKCPAPLQQGEQRLSHKCKCQLLLWHTSSSHSQRHIILVEGGHKYVKWLPGKGLGAARVANLWQLPTSKGREFGFFGGR